MFSHRTFLLIAFLLTTTPYHSKSEELTYEPQNPTFGGNAINGSGLLGNATSQRQFPPPERKTDTIKEFKESVQRSIMSEVSRQIANSILGEDAKDSGRFSVGSTTIDFHRQGENVVIELTDDSNGGRTTIEVPRPVY